MLFQYTRIWSVEKKFLKFCWASIAFVIALNSWTVFGSIWLCSTCLHSLLMPTSTKSPLSRSTSGKVLEPRSSGTLPELLCKLLHQRRAQHCDRYHTYCSANAALEDVADAKEAKDCCNACLCSRIFVSLFLFFPTSIPLLHHFIVVRAIN